MLNCNCSLSISTYQSQGKQAVVLRSGYQLSKVLDLKDQYIQCLYRCDNVVSKALSIEYYFYLEMLESQPEDQNDMNDQQWMNMIRVLKERLMKQRALEYSTSQDYFYKKCIDGLIEKKLGNRNWIRANDVRFDDWKEYMEKYYGRDESSQELPELLEYFKYYTQDSICFNNKEFSFLALYHEKKKGVLYQQLKKKLNISDSSQVTSQVTKVKTQKKFDNVLSELELALTNDQSYLLNEMLRKLVNYYGSSNMKTLNKIDYEFKLPGHHFTITKTKNYGLREGSTCASPPTMMLSTNISVKNNNCFIKQKIMKKQVHRRFGSCQVPKSATGKSIIVSNKEKEKEAQKEKQKKMKILRRKSAQAISHLDSNTATSSVEGYRKENLQTQSTIQSKNSKSKVNEKNFRDRMEELRKKIKREKQNLSKKSQYHCTSKKKVKKLS